MRIKYQTIPYSRQTITSQNIKDVNKVLKSDFITQGPVNKKFEDAICKFVGSKHCATVNTATSALTIACKTLGLKKGDILWTSTNSFVASSNCGLLCGAKVDFIDIDLENYNLSIEKLEKKLVQAKKKNKLPKILISVHFAGHPCDMKKIFKLSQKYKFKIIEDASHALGSSDKNIKVGSCKYSDLTVFSFQAVKVITTGEGGCLTTNNRKLYEKVKLLRTHGITKEKNLFLNKRYKKQPWYYEQQILGTNYRLSDINSALGLSQLRELKKNLNIRKKLVKNYYQLFRNYNFKFVDIPLNIKSAHHLLPIFYNFKNFNEKINFFNYLRKKKIFLQVHYIPIYRQPYYQKLGFKINNYPNTEIYYKNIFSIPLFLKLNKMKQIFIVNQILSFFKKNK
jgi:UDP-4-amino-4,6-dideoxy-N-acetyl-beta-L-altrosamine transaminase